MCPAAAAKSPRLHERAFGALEQAQLHVRRGDRVQNLRLHQGLGGEAALGGGDGAAEDVLVDDLQRGVGRIDLAQSRFESSRVGHELALRSLPLEERPGEARAQVVRETAAHLLRVDAVEHVALEVDHGLEVLARLLGGAALCGLAQAEGRRDRDAGDQREECRDDARDQRAIARARTCAAGRSCSERAPGSAVRRGSARRPRRAPRRWRSAGRRPSRAPCRRSSRGRGPGRGCRATTAQRPGRLLADDPHRLDERALRPCRRAARR